MTVSEQPACESPAAASDYDQRFGAVRRVYGDAAYALLRELRFCVVGIGGVGSWAVEALARTGVGHISFVDFDEVGISNTNRQLHALTHTVGRKKAEVMAERIAEINPECDCHAIDDFLTLDTLEKYLNRGYDCVIDAIDSIKFKSAMIHYCRRNKIPIVATGGAGGMTDPTMIKVADLSRTYNDPLAAKVRKQLRERYGFPRNTKRSFGVECVFSSQQPVYPRADGSVSHDKPGIHGITLDCRFGYGSTMAVTASFGLVAASRAIARSLRKRQTT